MSREPVIRNITNIPSTLKSCFTEKGESLVRDYFQKISEKESNYRIVSKVSSGKVRDMYEFDIIVFETSNRLSVFDRVIKEDVKLKGCMLNCISEHNKILLEANGIDTDYVECLSSANYEQNSLFRLSKFDFDTFKNLVISKKLNMFPLEFIVRGYIVGSAWKAYSKGKSYCGYTFPEGMHEGQKLDRPILTPTTKASSGHDMPVTYEEAIEIVADWILEEDLSILSCYDIEKICFSSPLFAEAIFDLPKEAKKYTELVMGNDEDMFDDEDYWDYYEVAIAYCMAKYYVDSIYEVSYQAYDILSKMCEEKGILFIDTKFEFGFDREGNICLGDEVGTPDSSRFASADIYAETGKIVSMDKQIVRNYCSQIGFTGDEDQQIPELPEELWKKVTDTYIHIAELICGKDIVKNLKY